MILVLIFKAGNSLGESASNAVGSLRQRSWLDRTATSVWQRERAFVNLSVPTIIDTCKMFPGYLLLN